MREGYGGRGDNERKKLLGGGKEEERLRDRKGDAERKRNVQIHEQRVNRETLFLCLILLYPPNLRRSHDNSCATRKDNYSFEHN